MQSSAARSDPVRLRADAWRNRERILAAARDVFAEQGPDAPLDEIARRAGLGIGTLYRRFPDRGALIRQVVLDVLTRAAEESAAARDQEPDPFRALARYLHRMLDLRIGIAIPSLLGRVSLAETGLAAARERLTAVATAVVAAAHRAGTLRPDVTFGDLGLLVMRLSRPLPGPFSAELDRDLAHRQLDLLIDGLRADRPAATPLPGPALDLAELRALRTADHAADDPAENDTAEGDSGTARTAPPLPGAVPTGRGTPSPRPWEHRPEELAGVTVQQSPTGGPAATVEEP
jgi:AcrR family transcriptional regulator